MSFLMEVETFANLTNSTPELVRKNLQENNLTLLNGLSIGIAHKNNPNQKNFAYAIDKAKAVQYIKELKDAEAYLKELKEADTSLGELGNEENWVS